MATMGQRIKFLREEREYTQEQLGAMIGVSKSTIGMYELDKREPDKEKLETIADFFNVDMDYLYGKSSYKNKQEWLLHQYDVPNDIITSNQPLSEKEQQLVTNFQALNELGQTKAVEYVSDLTDNPKYTDSYVPEVLAASRPNEEMTDIDRVDLDNVLKLVEKQKQKDASVKKQM